MFFYIVLFVSILCSLESYSGIYYRQPALRPSGGSNFAQVTKPKSYAPVSSAARPGNLFQSPRQQTQLINQQTQSCPTFNRMTPRRNLWGASVGWFKKSIGLEQPLSNENPFERERKESLEKLKKDTPGKEGFNLLDLRLIEKVLLANKSYPNAYNIDGLFTKKNIEKIVKSIPSNRYIDPLTINGILDTLLSAEHKNDFFEILSSVPHAPWFIANFIADKELYNKELYKDDADFFQNYALRDPLTAFEVARAIGQKSLNAYDEQTVDFFMKLAKKFSLPMLIDIAYKDNTLQTKGDKYEHKITNSAGMILSGLAKSVAKSTNAKAIALMVDSKADSIGLGDSTIQAINTFIMERATPTERISYLQHKPSLSISFLLNADSSLLKELIKNGIELNDIKFGGWHIEVIENKNGDLKIVLKNDRGDDIPPMLPPDKRIFDELLMIGKEVEKDPR